MVHLSRLDAMPYVARPVDSKGRPHIVSVADTSVSSLSQQRWWLNPSQDAFSRWISRRLAHRKSTGSLRCMLAAAWSFRLRCAFIHVDSYVLLSASLCTLAGGPGLQSRCILGGAGLLGGGGGIRVGSALRPRLWLDSCSWYRSWDFWVLQLPGSVVKLRKRVLSLGIGRRQPAVGTVTSLSQVRWRVESSQWRRGRLVSVRVRRSCCPDRRKHRERDSRRQALPVTKYSLPILQSRTRTAIPSR
ncbi:hypothetical protein DFH09DRAFT_300517 [Mycena vulgaris]|nr:hypothetical protein DFH09DRAFT_300517 [Mycena vulgaris]